MEDIIGTELLKQAGLAGGTFTGDLVRTTALSDTGLDSLGFTTLMVELKRKLSIDPFARDDDIVYPETFGELIDLYAAEQSRS